MAMVNPAANPMQMLQDAMKMRQQPPVDPRSAALEQMMQQQGAQSHMPVMPPDQYMQQQQSRNPNEVIDDQGRNPGDEADAEEAAEANPDDESSEHSDEEMLNHIQNGISPQGDASQLRGKDPRIQGSDDPDNWPDTPEEFEKMYGRPPSTDSEVEFYYPEQGDSEGAMFSREGGSVPRQRNMPPSVRFQNPR